MSPPDGAWVRERGVDGAWPQGDSRGVEHFWRVLVCCGEPQCLQVLAGLAGWLARWLCAVALCSGVLQGSELWLLLIPLRRCSSLLCVAGSAIQSLWIFFSIYIFFSH